MIGAAGSGILMRVLDATLMSVLEVTLIRVFDASLMRAIDVALMRILGLTCFFSCEATAMYGHPQSLVGSPTNPRMVPHHKKLSYRH